MENKNEVFLEFHVYWTGDNQKLIITDKNVIVKDFKNQVNKYFFSLVNF